MRADDHLPWARGRVARLLAAGGPERLVLIAVSSLDFVAAVRGRTKRPTSAADQALMFAWREVADVLLVGARTLTVERYGELVPGRPQQVPIVTISRAGDLDFTRALRANTPPRLTVYGQPRADAPASVEWRALP